MSVELTVLAWSAILLIILILVSANGNVMAMGMAWGVGNREERSTALGWAARARRAYLNLLENLVPFAILVIIAQLANVHTELTAAGAQLFIVGRVVHAIVYITGLTFLATRTIAFAVSLLGTLMIAYAVLTTAPVAV